MSNVAASSPSRPAAVARSCVTTDVELPGGNIVSGGPPPTVSVRPPNGLKVMGGSDWPEFNQALLKATLATISGHEPDAMSLRIAATSAALAAFKPADEIEGMIAAQAVAMHEASMDCFRRAVIPGQPAEAASKLRKDGANLARAMADMLDALDRKRGKGPQVVRVERVVVHEGGQAIVGNVGPGAPPGGCRRRATIRLALPRNMPLPWARQPIARRWCQRRWRAAKCR